MELSHNFCMFCVDTPHMFLFPQGSSTREAIPSSRDPFQALLKRLDTDARPGSDLPVAHVSGRTRLHHVGEVGVTIVIVSGCFSRTCSSNVEGEESGIFKSSKTMRDRHSARV